MKIYLSYIKLKGNKKNSPSAWGEKSVRGTTQFFTQLHNGLHRHSLLLFQPAA